MIHAKLSPGNTGRVPASRADLPIALGKSIVGNSHHGSGEYRSSPPRDGISAPATASPDAAELRPQAPLAGFRASAEEHLAQLHLLIIDDDPPVRSACAEIAGGMGFATRMADSVAAAREALAAGPVDLVLLDLRLPGGGGLAVLDEIRSSHPETLVLIMTAYATVSSAVEAMRTGASDYLTKPFSLEQLSTVLQRAAERRSIDVESRSLREHLRNSSGLGDLIGRSPAMEKLYRILSKVAHTTHPLLILGESGTGKELVARSIHNHGPNANKPFIAVDCGSLVPSLIESELFGYVKGAFTGANRSRTGLLAAAEGGTVFLDEVGELPLDLQARLLRALQEKEIRPIGSNQAVPINARILAATNRDLTAMVETGQFRKDLFFRLNVVNLRIPPLRERKADIPLLAAHVLERVRRDNGLAYSFSDDALRLMMDYDWPGNVREMEHAIERACALSSGPVLHMADFPTQMQDYRMHLHNARQEAGHRPTVPAIAAAQENNVLSIAELEKNAILNTIRQLKGDKLMAARLLGIGKTTLYRKLKEYGLGEDQSLI
jgi:two-component system response regulator HydG